MTGKSCLDLFAGSGALGLEALSRGANRVDAVDSQGAVVRQLRQSAEELGVAQLEGASYAAHHAEATTFLGRCRHTYDVVFLDPPFAMDPWTALFRGLPAVLKPGGLVYVEAGAPPAALHPPPPGWLMIRSARAGAVWFALFRCEYSQADPAPNETDNDDPSRLPRNV
jgi:16S rRNA (guanine966-N2)-methyltransferase